MYHISLKLQITTILAASCLVMAGGAALAQDGDNAAAQAEAELREFLEYQKEQGLDIIDPEVLNDVQGEGPSLDVLESLTEQPAQNTAEAVNEVSDAAEEAQSDLDRILNEAQQEAQTAADPVQQAHELMEQLDAAAEASATEDISAPDDFEVVEEPVEMAEDAAEAAMNAPDAAQDISAPAPAEEAPLMPMPEELAAPAKQAPALQEAPAPAAPTSLAAPASRQVAPPPSSPDRIIKVSEDQLRKIRADNVILQSDIMNMQKQMAANDAGQSGLSTAQVQAQKELLQQQIEELYEKLARQKIAMEESSGALQNVDVLRSENEALRAQNERYLSYREDNALLRHELEISSKKIQDLALQVDQLDQDRSALTQVVSEVDLEKTQQLKTQHALLAQENDQLAQRLAVAKKAGQMLYDQLNQAKKEISLLSDDLTLTNKDLQTTQQALDQSILNEMQMKEQALKATEEKTAAEKLAARQSILAQRAIEQARADTAGPIAAERPVAPVSALTPSIADPVSSVEDEMAAVMDGIPQEGGFVPHNSAVAAIEQSEQPKLADEVAFAPSSSTPQEQAAAQVMEPFTPSFSVQSLLKQAGLDVSNSFTFVEEASTMTAATYEWMKDGVYGSASQQVFEAGADDDFDARVQSYLGRLESRCSGDFAIMPVLDELSIDGPRVDQYDIACIQDDVQASAALTFFEKGNTFAFISYEAPEENMDIAMDFREKTLKTIKAF